MSLVILFLLIMQSVAGRNLCEFYTEDGTSYGHDLKAKKFLLAETYTNLNHGSYGTVPKPVAEEQAKLFLQQEARPDPWFRVSDYEYIDTSRKALATYLNGDNDDIVLVENASSGINSVLRSLQLKRGDKLLHFNTAYGMVKETLNYLADTVGIEVVVVNITFPMTDYNQMLAALEDVLKDDNVMKNLKLCVFSHISSIPAIIEPINELSSLVLSMSGNNTPAPLILVDGAHVPGQIPLQLNDLSVDFYVGNCHKWLYAPKGTAFLWTSKAQQLELSPEPTVISSSGAHDYIGRYAYTGTRDYTHFSALPVALEFREYLGGDEHIMTYLHQLATEGGELLTSMWNTSLLVPMELCGAMVHVVMPSVDADAIAYVRNEMDSKYDVYFVYSWIPDKNSNDEGDLIYYARLSAQVYLEVNDFKRMGELFLLLLEEYYDKLSNNLSATVVGVTEVTSRNTEVWTLGHPGGSLE